MRADIEDYFLNPPPGSAAARALEFGIDLTLTLENLRFTPEERIRKLDDFINSDPGVPLAKPRCTPGYILPPASAGYCRDLGYVCRPLPRATSGIWLCLPPLPWAIRAKSPLV